MHGQVPLAADLVEHGAVELLVVALAEVCHLSADPWRRVEEVGRGSLRGRGVKCSHFGSKSYQNHIKICTSDFVTLCGPKIYQNLPRITKNYQNLSTKSDIEILKNLKIF